MSRSDLRDFGLFTAWLGGLILLGGLAIFLSAPLRSRRLVSEVDAILAERQDGRRLDGAEPLRDAPGRLTLGGGLRYSIQRSDSVAFLVPHTFNGLGAFYLYIINPDGAVEQPIPLSSHSHRLYDFMPTGIRQFHLDRVFALGEWFRERE